MTIRTPTVFTVRGLFCFIKVSILALPILVLGGITSAQNANGPQEFAPGIISTGKGFTVTFLPDGKTVYFTARQANSSAAKPPLHIYQSRLQGSQWQPAKEIRFSSSQWSDLDPFVTVEGERMFFVSTRPAPGKTSDKPDMDIWYSDLKAGEWSDPKWIAEVNSDAKEGAPSLDRKGNLYFFSDRGAAANQNSIYVAHWEPGHFTAPPETAGANQCRPVGYESMDCSGWHDAAVLLNTSRWIRPGRSLRKLS